MIDQGETGEELVTRAQAGCLVSFEKLVTLHQDRLFTFLLQMVGNRQDAEDVAQESFVKAYQHLANYDGRARFSTWLFAIAKNTAYNHLRRRRPHQPIEDLVEVLAEDPPALDSSERNSIWDLARQLKPTLFETLWLFYAEGFSLKEIAEIMHVNAITARVNLFRARAALGGKLKKSGLGPLANRAATE